eukprot:5489863-Lingulodinium_polyedra.AAC.1
MKGSCCDSEKRNEHVVTAKKVQGACCNSQKVKEACCDSEHMKAARSDSEKVKHTFATARTSERA